MTYIVCTLGGHRWHFEGRTVFVAPYVYDYRCERCGLEVSLPEPLAEADREVPYRSGGSPDEGYWTVLDFSRVTDWRHRAQPAASPRRQRLTARRNARILAAARA